VEQLEEHQPYCAKSPNHYLPGQILVGFMLSVIAGARRFAHSNQLRADRALHALLGMKRFPSDDTILNYFRRFSQAEIERFWRPLWRWLVARLTTYLKSRLYQIIEWQVVDAIYSVSEFRFKLWNWKNRAALFCGARTAPNQQAGCGPQAH
jgi:hypothetical protein